MEEELKPCPACESNDVGLSFGNEQVVCHDCLMKGPESETCDKDEAIAAWNALPRKCEDSFILQHFVLPRRLRWTREKPTEEGWYWLKEEGRHAVVKTTAGGMISEPYVRHVNEIDGEWAGPIPEPTD